MVPVLILNLRNVAIYVENNEKKSSPIFLINYKLGHLSDIRDTLTSNRTLGNTQRKSHINDVDITEIYMFKKRSVRIYLNS